MLDLVNRTECEGHTFEILRLEKKGEWWHAHFAVDGVKYPPFDEPACNVDGLTREQFLYYMRAQSLTMMQHVQETA